MGNRVLNNKLKRLQKQLTGHRGCLTCCKVAESVAPRWVEVYAGESKEELTKDIPPLYKCPDCGWQQTGIRVMVSYYDNYERPASKGGKATSENPS